MNEKNKKTLVDLMRPKTVVGSALQNEYGSMPYYGEGEIDSLINIVNRILKNSTQQYPTVGFYDMPEAGRFTDDEIKSLGKKDDSFYEKMIDDERQETSTKAAIMLSLLQSGAYNSMLGNVPDSKSIFEDFTKRDIRKVFGDKSSQ
jgi:flagellar motor switch protein FliM|tara:strand:- start:43 stop:480 length:438 start_codon:yes stop_codon:yes gene_type:complete